MRLDGSTQPNRRRIWQIVKGMQDQGGTFLLHGVTGSGKTEVYLQAIAKAIETGGRAIVLVPEISLTPQTVGRFRSRFGQRIAVLHSRLSPGERFDEWRRIRLGQVDVVIGARSAIFAPLENIRLIVIDEEHESSYRSEITPRYSAQEVARKRCRQWGATLVLGSATPSVTAYLQAVKGRYTLLSMPDRVRDLPMPAVEIADMRAEFAAGNTSIFSGPLYRRLQQCLEAGEQAILFFEPAGVFHLCFLPRVRICLHLPGLRRFYDLPQAGGHALNAIIVAKASQYLEFVPNAKSLILNILAWERSRCSNSF